jgi:hypothetical protein
MVGVFLDTLLLPTRALMEHNCAISMHICAISMCAPMTRDMACGVCFMCQLHACCTVRAALDLRMLAA